MGTTIGNFARREPPSLTTWAILAGLAVSIGSMIWAGGAEISTLAATQRANTAEIVSLQGDLQTQTAVLGTINTRLGVMGQKLDDLVERGNSP